jgi:signal transduction histidine kinase
MLSSARPHLFLGLVALAALFAVLRLGSALARARSRAAESERLATTRGRWITLAAHEIRGLAAGLSGFGAPGRGAPAQAASREDLDSTGSILSLFRLADQLAEVADESGPRVIHEAPAALGLVVSAAIAAVDAQIRPGRRLWQVDEALRGFVVRADRRALEGALACLLRRAASQSREGDAISLRWVVASETVAIVVEDEGGGLSAMDGGDIRIEAAAGVGARAWLTLPRARLLEAA